MHYTGHNQTLCATYVSEPDINARLNWLAGEIARDEARQRLFRNPREREESLSMQHPLSTKDALGRFGLLLGLFPPAAIFFKILQAMDHSSGALVLLVPVMLVICGLVGRAVGGRLSNPVDEFGRRSWHWMLIVPALLGIFWGIVTGGAGGAVVFGIGAIGGIFCAVPVGTAAFMIFVPLHRLLARGGMIEARHFWPLAAGVTAVVSASILGLTF